MKKSMFLIMISSFFSLQTYNYFPTKLQETLLFIYDVMPEDDDIVLKSTLKKLLTENNNLSKDKLIDIITYSLLIISHNENHYSEYGEISRIIRYLNSQQQKLFEFIALENTKPRLRIIHPKNKKSNTNELCFNACMMSNNVIPYPDTTLNIFYDSPGKSFSINAWKMNNSNIPQEPINIQFAIPQDLDTTKPVIVELHFFINKFMEILGNTANITMNAVYMGAQEEREDTKLGMGFTSETIHSNDFIVIEPIDLFPQQNVLYSTVKIPLNESLITKKNLVHLSFIRNAPKNLINEYNEAIFLSMCVLKYNRILS